MSWDIIERQAGCVHLLILVKLNPKRFKVAFLMPLSIDVCVYWREANMPSITVYELPCRGECVDYIKDICFHAINNPSHTNRAIMKLQ